MTMERLGVPFGFVIGLDNDNSDILPTTTDDYDHSIR